MKSIVFMILGLLPFLASADYLTVKGMYCRACEKQVTAVVCQDPEMSQWFDSCAAKVTDATHETGELRYAMKKGLVMDEARYSKIAKAVETTGRTVEKPSPQSLQTK
jgi:hypothetical protein